jgi:A/G-specific adenine glycosylase
VALHVFECRAISGRARPLGCDEVRWVRPRELSSYPFPAANARIIDAILARG